MKSGIFKSIMIACTMVLFLSCSKSSSSYGSNTPPPGNSNSNDVKIANMSFAAATITINKGTKVTWTNNDNMTHTVTADDGSFDSGDLNKGDTYSYTFGSTGTFAYHCSFHSGMTGSVVVK
ncbi:cupredoxin domain-containing protein [Ilyomonas limi]|nr:cupredoxin family copper-binding protein [Ilyomonas limi]